MNNLERFYPQLAELYKKYADRAQALYAEFEQDIISIVGTDSSYTKKQSHPVSNIFCTSGSIQVYPDVPSKDAEFYFEVDDAIFYTTCVDGVNITECVYKRKCPICGKFYSEYPAVSRIDDETEICPQCGIEQAIESWVDSDADNSPTP